MRLLPESKKEVKEREKEVTIEMRNGGEVQSRL
jgi:hypothetical protein